MQLGFWVLSIFVLSLAMWWALVVPVRVDKEKERNLVHSHAAYAWANQDLSAGGHTIAFPCCVWGRAEIIERDDAHELISSENLN